MSESGPVGARALSRAERVAAAERLADAVSARLGTPVRLTVHDNRSTMVSFQVERSAMRLRVHHMFLGATDEMVAALAAFTSSPGRARDEARAAIDEWVRARREHIAPPGVEALVPRGRIHDLQEMLDRLNAEWFGGAVEARIGWGRSGASPGSRSIRTGVYLHAARAIRIHPALDREEVPAFYVEAVVFHEMLHQVVPPEVRGRRRVVHGPAFRRRERAWPGYARARAWEKSHIGLLLAGRPRRR